jgi:hypothetical protein
MAMKFVTWLVKRLKLRRWKSVAKPSAIVKATSPSKPQATEATTLRTAVPKESHRVIVALLHLKAWIRHEAIFSNASGSSRRA